MTEKKPIMDTSLDQLENKALFDKARDYAFDYMDLIHAPGRKPARPVFPGQDALDQLAGFKEPFPDEPGGADQILDLLHTLGSPASVAQTGGRYFGFVNGSAFPVALAAKWMADVWDQNAGMHATSPIAAALESVCQSWLIDLFGLPQSSVAGFVSGTSTATFAGLAAARNQVLSNMGWDIREKGLFKAPCPRVILGEQAHSTVFKALSLLGFGRENLELIPCDSQGGLRPEKLPELDKTCMVIAQAGNVNTGAFDPLDEICDRAQKAWVHVDGAFGLWAAASPSHAPLVKGMEKADSWSVDAHKTLNTPYDCGIILCRHPKALVSALQNRGDYIIYGEQRDPMLYTPEMSRRARGIELWATLKFLGRSGVSQLVDQLCSRAKLMGDLLNKEGFTILNKVVFNQVLVSCETPDMNPTILTALEKEGTCWCGGSIWNGVPVIRISVCSWATTKTDIKTSVDAFVRARDMVKEAD